jgi:hypothetical protein
MWIYAEDVNHNRVVINSAQIALMYHHPMGTEIWINGKTVIVRMSMSSIALLLAQNNEMRDEAAGVILGWEMPYDDDERKRRSRLMVERIIRSEGQ